MSYKVKYRINIGKKKNNRLAIWFEMLRLKAKDREKNIIVSIKWL